MPLLFAFWAVDARNRPTDPDALRDPWGEPCPFTALDAYDRETLGPFLTVRDEASGVLFAGDASGALAAFVRETAGRTGWSPPPDLDVVDRALDACAFLASEAASEAAHEAAGDWREPTPDTWRTGPLPLAVRRAIRDGADEIGREEAGRALQRHLLQHAVPARRAA